RPFSFERKSAARPLRTSLRVLTAAIDRCACADGGERCCPDPLCCDLDTYRPAPSGGMDAHEYPDWQYCLSKLRPPGRTSIFGASAPVARHSLRPRKMPRERRFAAQSRPCRLDAPDLPRKKNPRRWRNGGASIHGICRDYLFSETAFCT